MTLKYRQKHNYQFIYCLIFSSMKISYSSCGDAPVMITVWLIVLVFILYPPNMVYYFIIKRQ